MENNLYTSFAPCHVMAEILVNIALNTNLSMSQNHSVLETIHMVVKYKLAIKINIFQSQKLSVLLRP